MLINKFLYALLFVVVLEILAKAGKAVDIECLVGVEDKPEGVELSLFHGRSSSSEAERFEQRMVPGRHLPPECGSLQNRCQDLLVETSARIATQFQHIVFVPLVHGILLVELVYDGDATIKYSGHYVVDTTAVSCSPTAMYKVLNSFYAVCMNFDAGYLSVIEIALSKSRIDETTISGPLIEYMNLPSLTAATNFVYINGSTFKHIAFGLGSVLHILDPITYTSDTYSLATVELNCINIQEIAVIPGNLSLVAYCANDIAVYYAVDVKDWYYAQEYPIQGRPYFCSSSRQVSVFVGDHYVQYHDNNTAIIVDLHGTMYDSGICFQSGAQTFFVYNDLEDGSFAIDLKTSSSMQLFNSSCSSFHCNPPILVNMTYLVVNGNGNVIVLDASQNLSLVINTQHSMPDLVTVVYNKKPATSSSLGPILGPVIAAVIICIVVVIAGIAARFIYRRYPRKVAYGIPEEADGEDGEQQQ